MNINIGIHTGIAIVGNVGAPQIMEFTAVGDTVNIAARLQQKSSGGRVLVSEAVYQNVSAWMREAALQAEPMGALQLKGRSSSVVTYALTAAPD
jgi:adenylate cyclase